MRSPAQADWRLRHESPAADTVCHWHCIAVPLPVPVPVAASGCSECRPEWQFESLPVPVICLGWLLVVVVSSQSRGMVTVTACHWQCTAGHGLPVRLGPLPCHVWLPKFNFNFMFNLNFKVQVEVQVPSQLEIASELQRSTGSELQKFKVGVQLKLLLPPVTSKFNFTGKFKLNTASGTHCQCQVPLPVPVAVAVQVSLHTSPVALIKLLVGLPATVVPVRVTVPVIRHCQCTTTRPGAAGGILLLVLLLVVVLLVYYTTVCQCLLVGSSFL